SARRGVAAADPARPLLSRVNIALGGSFTSRLNQDLREEHGWSYGAHSDLSLTREPGLFVATAAVQTEHPGEALAAMLADVEKMAKTGLTDEEVDRTKKLGHADLVAAFETVGGAVLRFGSSAGLGLPPAFEATSSLAAARADRGALDRAASTA